jgi:hypothetical protein
MRHLFIDLSKTFSGYADVVLPRTKCMISEITATMSRMCINPPATQLSMLDHQSLGSLPGSSLLPYCSSK